MSPFRAAARPKVGVVGVAAVLSALTVSGSFASGSTAVGSSTPLRQVAATTSSVSAMSDTVVKSTSPATVFGAARTLDLASTNQGLLMFKTPLTPSGSSVTSAQLCLTPTTGSSTPVTVFTAPWGWTEPATTWNTKPYVEKTQVAVTSGALTAGKRVCLPVAPQFLEVHETELRLASGSAVSFASREAGAAGPTLSVTYDGASTSTSTPTASPTAAPTASATPTAAPTTATPTADPSSSPTAAPSSSPTASPTASPSGAPSPVAGKVLWSGDFESGGVPHGANGISCGTGSADGPDASVDQYSSVEEMGNTACTSSVAFSGTRTRTADSKRSMKIVMGAGQQRELAASKFTWTPDAKGSVDQWYGFSMYYDSADWLLGGGLLGEVSGSSWHTPVAWRMDGDNGSLNFSGDMNTSNANGQPYKNLSSPHMFLRRNTVQNSRGFYKDGQGVDKLDLGPIVTDKWMDFVCHIRWSTTSTNALRECWRDGQYMGSKTTLNAVDAKVHKFRIGQYQETNLLHPRTSYFDNVRIGTSYDAVDPSRTH